MDCLDPIRGLAYADKVFTPVLFHPLYRNSYGVFFVDEYPPVYREPEVFPEADVQGGAVASFDDAVFHGVLGIKKIPAGGCRESSF